MTPKELQDALARAGYAPGAADGEWGPNTERAAKIWFDEGRDIPITAPPATPHPPVTPDLIPIAWLTPAAMRRIVTHWTAGAYRVSELDKEHYHIIIAGDGTLVRGDNTIDANVSTSDGDYAAHTKNCNSGSIGVSVACMAGAIERPFSAGPYPMTLKQWEAMARVCAQLCQFYGIQVTPTTVLGHGEVQKNLGIVQNGKWDPMVLPWKPTLTFPEVGNLFRNKVKEYMT